jgi:hypothetical protein
MVIEQVIALILITFTISFYLGYKEGREDGLAASLKWRRNMDKAAR